MHIRPAPLLAWLGRQGARAVAALVFIGIALPQLGTLLRPYVTEAIFLLLTISFMRVNATALREHLRRPTLVVAATLWSAIGVPLLFYVVSAGIGLKAAVPGLFLGLMLQGLASPMMAAPTLAALTGLDATLVLITLVTGTALVPIVAFVFAQAFLADTLTISPLSLGMKLAVILAGSLSLACIVRRLIGMVAIVRHSDALNGVNTLAMFVFVSAVMRDIASEASAHPAALAGLAVLAFAVFLALLLGTALMFRKAGRDNALSLGIMASQRNMGLMLAATDGVLPATTWTYFALCQFPIYLSRPLLQWVLRRTGATSKQASPSVPT